MLRMVLLLNIVCSKFIDENELTPMLTFVDEHHYATGGVLAMVNISDDHLVFFTATQRVARVVRIDGRYRHVQNSR